MEIFHLTKGFPRSEVFGVSSQMIRSSRAACSAIAKNYRKRQYEKRFKSKLSDADSENSETQLWLDFVLAYEYITTNKKLELESKSEEVGKLINYMINNPSKFN